MFVASINDSFSINFYFTRVGTHNHDAHMKCAIYKTVNAHKNKFELFVHNIYYILLMNNR